MRVSPTRLALQLVANFMIFIVVRCRAGSVQWEQLPAAGRDEVGESRIFWGPKTKNDDTKETKRLHEAAESGGFVATNDSFHMTRSHLLHCRY